jgi:hypothetical protein
VSEIWTCFAAFRVSLATASLSSMFHAQHLVPSITSKSAPPDRRRFLRNALIEHCSETGDARAFSASMHLWRTELLPRCPRHTADAHPTVRPATERRREPTAPGGSVTMWNADRWRERRGWGQVAFPATLFPDRVVPRERYGTLSYARTRRIWCSPRRRCPLCWQHRSRTASVRDVPVARRDRIRL